MSALLRLSMVLAVFAGLGCQAPGKVVTTEMSLTCPTCKVETRTTPIKGLNYKAHVCPECRTETDPVYSDVPVQETVHFCDTCRNVMGVCEQCAAKRH